MKHFITQIILTSLVAFIVSVILIKIEAIRYKDSSISITILSKFAKFMTVINISSFLVLVACTIILIWIS